MRNRADIVAAEDCGELTRLPEDDGRQLVAQRGTHQQYERPTKPGKVTVARKLGADVPTPSVKASGDG